MVYVFYSEGFEKYRGYPIERLNYVADLKKCSWKDKANEPATRSSMEELKNASSFEGNAENKIEEAKKDQRTNRSVFFDYRIPRLSINDNSETLSKTEKQCITDHLLTSHCDLYNT